MGSHSNWYCMIIMPLSMAEKLPDYVIRQWVHVNARSLRRTVFRCRHGALDLIAGARHQNVLAGTNVAVGVAPVVGVAQPCPGHTFAGAIALEVLVATWKS